MSRNSRIIGITVLVLLLVGLVSFYKTKKDRVLRDVRAAVDERHGVTTESSVESPPQKSPPSIAGGAVPRSGADQWLNCADDPQVDELAELLSAPSAAPDRGWYAKIDEKMIALVRDCSHKTSTETFLIDVAEDTRLDPVVRNYALQYCAELALVALEGGALAPGENVPSVARLIDALWRGVEDGLPGMPGTALLGLTRLAGSQPHAPALSGLPTAVLRIATDENSSEIDRATALSLCGQLQLAAAAPVLRAVVSNSESKRALRLAGIGALGLLGDQDAVPVLREVLSGQDRLLRNAAEVSLKRIQVGMRSAQVEGT